MHLTLLVTACLAAGLRLHTPRLQDAVWLTTDGRLRCCNAAEVLLLLKSSDAAVHDLCHAYDACADAPVASTPPQLVLKRWRDLRPEREFRCFARHRRLVAVSQRHAGDFYPALSAMKGQLVLQLEAFHDNHVAHQFPHPDCALQLWFCFVTCALRKQPPRHSQTRTMCTSRAAARCSCWTSTPGAAPRCRCCSPGRSWSTSKVRKRMHVLRQYAGV